MTNTDECTRARDELKLLKRRVPAAQSLYGMKRWSALVNVTSPMERRNAGRPVVNRAYHKLHEIVLSCALRTIRRSAHLCEAPGGFVQCVADTIADSTAWEWIAVTLEGHDAPQPASMLVPYGSGKFIHMDVLKDADECVSMLGGVDLVTADGAVMMDHDNIETAHYELLDAQSWIALRCLEKGGTFVVKAFECLESQTRKTIAWVSSHFERTAVIKPYSSRPTNSERYFVFRGFHGYDGYSRAVECFTSESWDVHLQNVMVTLARRQMSALSGVLPHQNTNTP